MGMGGENSQSTTLREQKLFSASLKRHPPTWSCYACHPRIKTTHQLINIHSKVGGVQLE